MESTHGDRLPSEQARLLDVVRGVRNRYRAKRGLRGAAVAVAASWVVLAITSYVLSVLKYSDGAVVGGRAIAGLLIVAIVARCVVMPLLPRLRDEQVALYLEEHEHSLKASVLTAV